MAHVWLNAGPEHETFIFECYKSTRLAEMQQWGWSEPQANAFLQMQYTAQSRSYALQYPNARTYVIQQDGQWIGRMIVDSSDTVTALIDITLLPSYQNQGIGSQLIRELQAEASRSGKGVVLHVQRTNPAAKLYQRLGFQPIGGTELYERMEWPGNLMD